MSWSTAFIVAGAFICGSGVTVGYYERAARVETQRQLKAAEERPAQQIADERKLTAAVDTRDRGKAAARQGVAAAPLLADCPIPDDLASMLVTQAQATRNGASAGVSDHPVP